MPNNNLALIFKQCHQLADTANIIIASGAAPKNAYLYKLLAQARHIICCDGALNTLEQNNIEPNYIVGDCDSISQAQKQKHADKIKYSPDQNSNDLTKAIDFAVNELHLDNIIILGATGLREDHSLANIALLVKYAQYLKNIILLSDYGFFKVYTEKVVVPTVCNQQISLFAISNNCIVTTHGLKWDLNNLVLDSWHSGTLNQATSTSFVLQASQPVIVYHAFELKNSPVTV